MSEYLRKDNDVFEIVDTVPLGYSIWNIGRSAGNDLKSMERYLENHPHPVPGTREASNVARIQKALPYLRELRYY